MRYYRRSSHSKFDLKINLVWCPKYRKSILTGVVGTAVRDIIRRICNEEEVEIISGKVAPDHIHIFVSFPPSLAVSKLVQRLKGKSSYLLFQEFPHIKKIYWGRHFWARGYLGVTSGNITDEMIKQYIAEQEGEPLEDGLIKVGE